MPGSLPGFPPFTLGTPPILPPGTGGNPSASPAPGGTTTPATGLPGFAQRLGTAFNSPMGRFGLNVLANSGPSVVPRGFGEIVGRAGLQTLQQGQQQGLNDLQRRLIESRIGLNQARANQPTDPTNTNVQSTFRGDNGNMFIVRRDGSTVDTGVQFDRSSRVFKTSDDRFVVTDDDGNVSGVIDTSEQTTQNLAERAGATAEASAQAQADVRARSELPEKIAQDQSFIDNAERFVGLLESGELETGPFAGRFPALTTNAQLFDAFSGENIIESISSATFGQLSEGERQFIATTNPNRRLTEEANIDIIKRKIRMIRGAQGRARRRLEGGETSQDDEFAGFSIVE